MKRIPPFDYDDVINNPQHYILWLEKTTSYEDTYYEVVAKPKNKMGPGLSISSNPEEIEIIIDKFEKEAPENVIDNRYN
jgi:hypothetical protein